MLGIVHSELLKIRHTVSMKLVVFAPLAMILLSYVLSSSAFQHGAYNWWYTIALPIVVSLWSADMVIREKNTGMQNIVCLPFHSEKIWLCKTIALTIILFAANLFMWLFTTAVACFTDMEISPLDSLIGCTLLFLTYIWQLPFIMLLASKIGYLPTVLASFAGNIILSFIGATKSWFFFNPYAIPARVVCPFFQMKPNGLPLENGSPLSDTRPILSAIAISLLLAVIVILGSTKLLGKGGKSRG